MRLNAAATQTKSEAAYSSLVAAIESGELAPGSRVTLAELASQLGMSFTPVRDALVLLAEQGYIDRRPNHATVIKGPMRQRSAETSLLRAALEPLAARLAASAADLEAVAAIEAACDELDRQVEDAGRETAASASPAASSAAALVGSGSNAANAVSAGDANAAFHRAVADASGSTLLAEFVTRVWKTIPVQGLTVAGRLAQAATEHREIFTAIRSGDADRAAALMADHVGHVAQATEQFFDQESTA